MYLFLPFLISITGILALLKRFSCKFFYGQISEMSATLAESIFIQLIFLCSEKHVSNKTGNLGQHLQIA